MNEFDYLKVGDKCWVWDSIRNVTEESRVTCRAGGKVDVENIGTFHLEDGRCSMIYNTPHLRLVHAPFKAEFPPKPKRKVKKEGWVRVWKNRLTGELTVSAIRGSKLDALFSVGPTTTDSNPCGDPVKVTWEEEE